MIELVKAGIDTVGELEFILNSMDQDSYQKIGPMTDYSVGRHVRHIVGFYLALEKCCESFVADYTVRQRDNVIETDLNVAKEQLTSIKNWLHTLKDDRQIEVVTEVNQLKTVDQTITSSLYRELAYVSEHSVHHMAYIGLMLKTMNVCLDKEVGIAPSTATYLRAQNESEQKKAQA